MNPFQALLDNYHNNRDKQEYQKFIEEERRRHGHHLQGRGVGEWRPFLVAPRRAATAGRGGGRPHELRCWPGATTEDASGPCRGPLAFSFDHAIHRPFCASPSPRQPSTAWTPSPPPAVPSSPSVFAWSTGSPAHSTSSTPPSAPSLVPVSTRPRPLLLPALSPAPAKAAAATTAGAAAAVAAVATTVTPAEEESTDALLSLVTLSCTSSPAASPRPTSRLLRPERLAELRKRKRDAANDEPAGPQLVDQDERQPLRDDDDGDGADQEEDRRPRLRRFGSAVGRHKRRRVDMTAVGVDACAEAAIDRGEQEEGQQGAEDSDVERDYSVDNNDDDDDDGDDDDQAEDGEHGIRVMTLGEESANEDETDEHRQQHQHQKTVMETETAATSCIAARRGPRRIWGWISARELESLKLYKPMAGCRRTRVARMGLHHLNTINRPHTGNNTV